MPYADKQKQKESHRHWHLVNRERVLKKQKEYRNYHKILVFAKYSNNDIKCACCGERQLEFLSIDHVNGGGTKHRKKIGNKNIYLWIVQNSYPDGFRVLCHNCNQAFGFFGYCPHQKRVAGFA